MDQFPRLRDDSTGEIITLRGRICTIGASRECPVRVSEKASSPIMGHILFSEGAFRIQKLVHDLEIKLNGRILETIAELRNGDNLTIGRRSFTFHTEESGSPVVQHLNSPILELVNSLVSLLRNKDQDVFSGMVSSVCRLLKSDASRLVIEHEESGERKTIARFPSGSGLERFSNRAIDWAKSAGKTVLAHDKEWLGENRSISSLEKNLVTSIMCAPLVCENRILGYLYLDRLQEESPFTEQDREFCDALIPIFAEILINYEERRRQQEIIASLQNKSGSGWSGMIFQSDAMSAVVQLARKYARTDSPVLIQGETGTGKELLARFVHENSSRAGKAFRAINCGAIPENLMESELFGYEKGAFTGATQRKLGLFEAAEGGTVFLDELGELPFSLQVKLLRVLQEAEVIRVGGTEPLKINVRVVAASNKNLESEVAGGRFRQDLFFRLNVLSLHIPSLRERGQDVILLGEYFVNQYCQQFGMKVKTLSAQARAALVSHSWPGNVRELENVVQKAILLCDGQRIGPDHIMIQNVGMSSVWNNSADTGSGTLKEARANAERRAIVNALSKSRGNISLAGKLLEIDRKWLMKKMEELGISIEEFRS